MKYTLGNSRLEVNGKQYLKDVGGYNGTNKDSSKDVATVIEDVTTAIDSKIDSMLSVNYFELVNLRDNGQLIPGQQYRITDYITTTVQEDTESAGHQFDIIVTANSNNTLNEIAGACLHVGDTYFSENGANLSAWQIWYCLDNDVDRFEWADGTNGKGVIYRMIDEWGNDCPYDFKNIKFTKPIISETDTPDSNLYYTFCSYDGNSSNIKDGSIFGNNYTVYNNVIKPYYFNTKQSLNRILFIGNNCYWYSNTFGYDCLNNTFGDRCYDNTFGNNCQYNTFGYRCASNTFGDNCHSNTFGGYCYSNTFGDWCGEFTLDDTIFQGNEFQDGCEFNLFGDYCGENKFNTYCCNQTFGNYCFKNTFGDSCHDNIFGTYCQSNTFGNSCYSNTFGNYCSFNTFGTRTLPKSFYRYIIFDSGNRYICLNCKASTSPTTHYQNVRIGLGVNNKNTYKTINDSNYNQTYETLYRPKDSKTLTVQ